MSHSAKRLKPSDQHLVPYPLSQSLALSELTDYRNVDGPVYFKYYVAYLHYSRVEVTDESSIKQIYEMGYYGKLKKITSDKRTSRKSMNSSFEENKSVDNRPCRSPRKSKTQKKIEETDIVEFKDKEENIERGTEEEIIQIEREEPIVPKYEKLYLLFEEAMFLAYGVGCLVVVYKEKELTIDQLWSLLCGRTTDGSFPFRYAVYHHFRTKGYVVKSGLKYGMDFTVYKDGPMFHHSSHTVLVRSLLLDVTQPLTWISMIAKLRISENANKQVLLCSVLYPHYMSIKDLTNPQCLSKFEIQELEMSRWISSKEREET